MELTPTDEKELKKMIGEKLAEKKGQLTDADQNEIAVRFLIERQNRIKGKGEEKDEDSEETALSTHAKAIHEANVIRIHKLIDKMEKNEVKGELQLSDTLQNEMPDEDFWDFSLGDKVVVDLPRGRFKFIQKQTLGWNKRLGNVLGQYGFITNIMSKFDCKVAVYFPEIFTNTMVFTGVLKKVEKDFHVVVSRWKVGDFVKTKKSKKLVKKFQKRLPDLPEKHIDRKGRVIAITSAAVYVTFNEKSSYAIDPALLQEADDTNPIVPTKVMYHPKGFTVGSKVRVMNNLQRLIENQKEFGGWNWKMSKLAGNLVRIEHIKKDDGSLIVRVKQGRTWRLNYESAAFEYDPMSYNDDATERLPFMPGDKVRLRISESIKVQLINAKVLESCIDFLKSTGVVEGIDDEFNVVVRFSNGKKRILKQSMIQKVRHSEEKRYEAMEAKKSNLAAGDIVKISLGPPRYVEDILSKMKMKESTRAALTQESELLGFMDEEHAVVQYEDGRKIRVNVKYLTPAEKHQDFTPKKIGFESLRLLIESVQSSIAVANVEGSVQNAEGSVDIFSVTSGTPPTVCLRLDSYTVKAEKVIDCLKQFTDWKIKETCENECYIKMADDVELDLVLVSPEEECASDKMKSIMDPVEDDKEEKTTKAEVVNEPKQNEKLKTEPFDTETLARDIRVTPSNLSQQPPPVQGWGDFRFITFHTTGGALYFPYLPHSHTAHVDAAPRRSDQSVNTNIIIQGNVGSVNQNI